MRRGGLLCGCVRTLVLAGTLTAAHANAASLDLLVEDMNSGDAQCGVSESPLLSRARLTLRTVGITVDKDATPFLYVRTNTLALSEGCVSNVQVSIQEMATLRQNAPFVPVRRNAMYSVCTSATVLTGPKHDFMARMLDSLEAVIKDCLGKVAYK